jgi:F420-dependent oxidoreductase-like protein
MRYGIMLSSDNGIDDLIDQTRRAKEAGFASGWVSQIFGLDALTALAVVGREVPGIELGTAVIPTYPRHPIMLGAQALTTQAAIGNRLALGIGLSHQIVIENVFGYSFEKPARHMREYLSILRPVIHGGSVTLDGETLKGNTSFGPITVPGAEPCQILIAALAPQMLKLAGTLAEGTITWMTGPATVADHIVPTMTAAAEKEGRPSPRVVVGLPICVTNDAEAARETAAKTFSIYGQLPSYRAMLDREGAAGPADVAIVGDEDTVAKQLQRLAEAGTTDFTAAPYGSSEEVARTFDLLKSQI